MNGKSDDIKQARLQELKGLFPDLFVEGQLDWEKLKAAFGDDINFANERYVLNWAGKSDAFKVLQQPTTATLKPIPEESYLTPGPSPEGEGSWSDFINNTTQNLFIEGENLEVLKVLQKAYHGKVKCIIIDPPYNTGSDSFIYPDKFSEKKEDYLKRIGDKDEEGYLMKEGLFRKNSKDSGHYHSNWLSMMYPRLFLAKNLLRDDGVIFVHIDDNEVHNLRMVMNEIFGEENFVAQFVWRRRTPSALAEKLVSMDHEYVLSYQKQDFSFLGEKKTYANYKNPDKDPNGDWMYDNPTVGMNKDQRPNQFYDLVDPKTGNVFSANPNRVWAWAPDTMKQLIKQGRIIFPSDPTKRPLFKRYKKDLKTDVNPISTLLQEVGLNSEATKTIQEMFQGTFFNYSKPLSLIRTVLKNSCNSDDIVLDFFAGSGTTAHAVLELNKEDGGNRKFILVQMPEPCDESSEAFKASYKTIADIGKERIRRVIKKITSPLPPSPAGEGPGVRYTESLFKGAGPTLFANARNMRKEKTEAEDKLWQELRNRAFDDYKFRRQHPIGKYIADFYCHDKKLVIEVDGGYHNEKEQQELDEQRTQVINDFGIQVIRLKNEDVLNDLPQALKKIRHLIHSPLSLRRGDGGEVGFKVFKLSSSNFKIWRSREITEENLEQQLDAFTNPTRPGAEKQNMLYELMLKAGHELTSPLTPLLKERGTAAPSPQGEGWGEVYSINNGELIIALDAMSKKLVEQIIAAKPQKVITLDSLFTGNDQLKTNTVLQMRDAGVDFKTI